MLCVKAPTLRGVLVVPRQDAPPATIDTIGHFCAEHGQTAQALAPKYARRKQYVAALELQARTAGTAPFDFDNATVTLKPIGATT